MSCDGTQDIAPSLLTQLRFKPKHIPKKEAPRPYDLDFGRQCPTDEDGDHGNKKNGARTRMCGRRWRYESGEKCSY